jgi:hypothetical protein
MDRAVEITTPETSNNVPWFPKQSYLIDRLAEKMMQITDDARHPQFEAKSDEELRRFLRMNNGNTLKTVELDPRRFFNPRNLKATKAYP